LHEPKKVLLLTEKPSQAKDFARALGGCVKKEGYYDCGKFLISWALGHLFEVDDSIVPRRWSLQTLPLFPSEFRRKLRRGAGKQFKVLKELLKRVDAVVVATDPGREGELIAREVLEEAGWRRWDRTYRFWTSEALTPEVVKKRLKELRPASAFDGLYYSALARQHADWIVGVNLTRLVSLKAKDRSVWSVGRVQTPTLKILVDREREVRNFVSEEYFVIKATFEKGRFRYEGTLLRERPKNLDLPEEEEGEE